MLVRRMIRVVSHMYECAFRYTLQQNVRPKLPEGSESGRNKICISNFEGRRPRHLSPRAYPARENTRSHMWDDGEMKRVSIYVSVYSFKRLFFMGISANNILFSNSMVDFNTVSLQFWRRGTLDAVKFSIALLLNIDNWYLKMLAMDDTSHIENYFTKQNFEAV